MSDYTEQAQAIVHEWITLDRNEKQVPVLIDRIASFAAEAATQGQATSDVLHEALRDAAIEAHVGFNHPRQWADCDLAVCSERKGLIGDCNE